MLPRIVEEEAARIERLRNGDDDPTDELCAWGVRRFSTVQGAAGICLLATAPSYHASVIDKWAAETEAQRRQALRQYEGALAELYERWRVDLIRAAALVEAVIDFSDEEIPADTLSRARAQATEIMREIQLHLSDARRGEILREGFRLTVIGPPNSGKSSLVNALSRRDVAIVSDMPGTTRDVLEVHLDLGGYPLIVADTAGLRATADAVENEGVRRALARAEEADAAVRIDGANPLDRSVGGHSSADEKVLIIRHNSLLFIPSAGCGRFHRPGRRSPSLPGAEGRGSVPPRGRRSEAGRRTLPPRRG